MRRERETEGERKIEDEESQTEGEDKEGNRRQGELERSLRGCK